jgi:hypothetical protein
MVFVTKEWVTFGWLVAVLAALSVLLYLFWYRHLSPSGWTGGVPGEVPERDEKTAVLS